MKDTAGANARRKFMVNLVKQYKEFLHWENITASEDMDEAFEQRIIDFFDYCIEKELRPTVEGFCASCGISRQTYNYWKNGLVKVSERRKEAIEKLEGILLALLSEWSLNGNVNPVIAIFNLKNNYDYKDQIEHQIKPSQTLLEKAKSPEEIAMLINSDAGLIEEHTGSEQK